MTPCRATLLHFCAFTGAQGPWRSRPAAPRRGSCPQRLHQPPGDGQRGLLGPRGAFPAKHGKPAALTRGRDGEAGSAPETSTPTSQASDPWKTKIPKGGGGRPEAQSCQRVQGEEGRDLALETQPLSGPGGDPRPSGRHQGLPQVDPGTAQLCLGSTTPQHKSSSGVSRPRGAPVEAHVKQSGCSAQSRSGAATHRKEDRPGRRFGCGPVGAHSDSLVSAQPPPRARGGERGSSVRGPRGSPQCHPPCRWVSPSLTHTCEAKGSRSGGGRALTQTPWRPGTGGEAEDTGLAGTEPPRRNCRSRSCPAPRPVPSKPAEAKHNHFRKQTRENRHKK